MFLSVVIPAYNEAQNLPKTVALLCDKLSACVPSFELLIVDDASRDRTGAVADELAANDARVLAIHHSENRGIGAGFVTALSQARGEWFMLIPADLAMDINELGKYFQAAQNADIAVGLRSDKSDYGLFRKLVSFTNITLVQRLFGMRERQFQYISLYRTHILREIGIEFYHSAFFHAEILIKAQARGYRLVEVEIGYIPRLLGRATGAKAWLIVHTMRDMVYFWLRGDWRPRK
ncbi:MAG: glycosyltransferase family 2 protein [Chloroflexi bacterium]|nr:glycosyltransferase family 2 protein [Chloroflexota bacterium]